MLREDGTLLNTSKETLPFTDISFTRKVVIVVWALWGELTVSLIITGWSAFLPVLVADGVYFEYCSTFPSLLQTVF
jgi:hypothetical protein